MEKPYILVADWDINNCPVMTSCYDDMSLYPLAEMTFRIEGSAAGQVR